MIREIKFEDKLQWKSLYRSYADFYKVEMTEEILNRVWKWLHNKEYELNGLVYEIDSNIVGFAHFRRFPSPLRGKDIGFLDNLFVDSKFRGKKIREKIFNKLNSISSLKGWNLIRWITHDNNL